MYFKLLLADYVSCLFGSSEEYDLPLWSWTVSDVWGSNDRMSDLS